MKNMTFEEAIAYTETLLSQQELGEGQLEIEIAKLVQTQNGARGFFVCFLTGEWQLADSPSIEIIRALRTAPNAIAELLVKNLAMSTAMEIYHQRVDNIEQAQGSNRVVKRTTLLITKLDLLEVRTIAKRIRESAIFNTGEYVTFLDKWGYDTEQKQAIAHALNNVIIHE